MKVQTRCVYTPFAFTHYLHITHFLSFTGQWVSEDIVDYCNSVLALVPKVTDELQQVLNAAARLSSDAGKCDRGLSQLLHEDLQWLDVPPASAVYYDRSPLSPESNTNVPH